MDETNAKRDEIIISNYISQDHDQKSESGWAKANFFMGGTVNTT